jgi:hypothetical protein
MANTLTTLTNAVLAQMAVDAAVSALAPLNAFTTDFSADAAKRGDKVKVKYIPEQDDAVDFEGTYVMQDGDAEGKDITLSGHKYVSWGFSDQELATRPQLQLEDLARQKGYKLAKKIFQDILSLVTDANFGTEVFNNSAANFDSDDVAAIRGACSTAGMPVDLRRSLILTPDYITSLVQDNAIKSDFHSDAALRDGIVARLMGFNVYETPNVPGNSENLVGFAAYPTALFVAMRYLQPGNGADRVIDAFPVIHEGTGMTFGYRHWYDPNSGVEKAVLECVYGKLVGDPAMLKRIES